MRDKSLNKAMEAPAVQTPGPIIPGRSVWLDVPEYPGFKVRLWSNMPNRLLLEIDSRDVPRVQAALLEIVLEHNGWRDEDGNEYPPADTQAFWDAIPQELAILVIGLIGEAPRQLPNSLMAMRRG